MPSYKVTDPNTGRVVKLTGDSPPTEQELSDIFSKLSTSNPEKKTDPAMEYQNWVGALFNVPAAAIRSTIQGKGYATGAMNPSKVEKFQDIAIRKAQFTTSPVWNAVLGMPASAVGMAADIITNPADVALSLIPATKPAQALGKFISATKIGKATSSLGKTDVVDATKATGRFLSSPYRWVKDAFTGIKKEREAGEAVKEAIRSASSKTISTVRKEGLKDVKLLSRLESRQRDALDKEATGFANALKSAENTYTGQVKDKSYVNSEAIRRKLPQLFKEKSEEYGDGLNKLLSENPVMSTQAEIVPVFEESLLNHGILGIDDAGRIVVKRTGATKAENQILNEYMRLRELPANTQINSGDILQSSTLIRPKYGKVWGSSEHLQSEVTEGLSSIVSSKSPEVAAFRKEYAPFLQWKKAAIKEFQPFAGRFSNEKGTKILSKYADVGKQLTRDESNLMSELEQYTKQDFTSDLKKLRGLGREIKSRKESASSVFDAKSGEIKDAVAAKKATIDELINARVESLKTQESVSIDKVNQDTQDIVEALRRRKLYISAGAAATAGPALLQYIKNRLAYGLFGIIGD